MEQNELIQTNDKIIEFCEKIAYCYQNPTMESYKKLLEYLEKLKDLIIKNFGCSY
jgi:hypothetical protein